MEKAFPSQTPPMTFHDARVWCVILIFACIALYSWTINFPLVYDDILNIAQNSSIRSLSPPWKPLIPQKLSSYSGRPFTNFTFAITYAISGTAPWAHRAFNILIHLATALILFMLVRRVLSDGLFGKRLKKNAVPVAGFGALLWMIHPVNTLAVTYITQRAESLMALFLVATLYCAYKSLQPDSSKKWAFFAGVFCFLGAGTKEVIAVAPLLVLAFDWLFISKGPIKALRNSPILYLFLSSCWLLLAPLTLTGRQAATGSMMQDPDVLGYLTTQMGVIVHYLKQIIWPFNLAFDYDWPLVGLQDVWLETLCIAVLLGVTFVGIFKRKGWAFLLFAFFLVLAPTSSILPISLVACDYRVYLPLAFLSILFTTALVLLAGRIHASRQVIFLAGLFLVLVLGATTVSRNRDFSSSLRLWEDTVQKQPENSRALAWYGEALVQAYQPERGLPFLQKALQLAPGNHKTMCKIALALHFLGKNQEALDYVQQAEGILPGYIPAIRLKPVLLLELDRKEEALKALEKLESHRPKDPLVIELRKSLDTPAAPQQQKSTIEGE